MKKKDLLFVVGTRPNFVKIAPICLELRKHPDISYKIVHTGQHYDELMSDIFFEELDIPAPDYYLKVGSGGHGAQTGRMMEKMEQLCQEQSFSAMVVIGDVNSTMAGALVASKLHIPVVHIESGLRSFNRAMPEEINRIVTDHVSDLLFAPTQLAVENLQKEGLGDRALFSGDVMYDMMLIGQEIADRKSRIMEELNLQPQSFYLGTLHRPYNVDEPKVLKEIIKGFAMLEKNIILAAHPRLRKNLEHFGISVPSNVALSKPLGYLDFITLQKHALRVITDSGGVQKEAFFVQTPCITLRPETEWTETVAAGANILVKNRTSQEIVEAAGQKAAPNYELRPYGGGDASQVILEKTAEVLLEGAPVK
jgi:UDP-GlcNAc3NAcA epimerase